MILLDANLLIYAYVSDVPEHEGARTWLDERLGGIERVGLPWPSLLTFLRLVTNPRVFPKPQTLPVAWRQVSDWLGARAAWVPLPTERHASVLQSLLAQRGMRSNLVPDAHLAALAIEHGLTLCSTDRDFTRFEGLRLLNPLQERAG